jgi:hypothetical protein
MLISTVQKLPSRDLYVILGDRNAPHPKHPRSPFFRGALNGNTPLLEDLLECLDGSLARD